MVDQHAETLALIDMVQKRPAIYDYTLTDYCNKTLQTNLWEEIAAELNHSGNAFCMFFKLKNCIKHQETNIILV